MFFNKYYYIVMDIKWIVGGKRGIAMGVQKSKKLDLIGFKNKLEEEHGKCNMIFTGINRISKARYDEINRFIDYQNKV